MRLLSELQNNNMEKRQSIFIFGITIMLYSILKILSFNDGMFWDSILILSKTATFLHDNGLSSFIYPSAIDNGDPQFVPFLIAFVWTIAGKSLFATHLLFSIVLIFAIREVYILTRQQFPLKYSHWAFALILFEPALMSQTLGLYQDAFIILFGIMAIRTTLGDNKKLLSIALFLLSITSRRGMLLAFGIMFASFLIRLIQQKNLFRTIKLQLPIYLPAALFVLTFIIWRKVNYGWFFTTDQTTTGQPADFATFIRNCIILIRWFVDNGRIFLWLAIIYLVVKNKAGLGFIKKEYKLIVVLLSILFVMMSVTLTLQNPFGARYFILHYMLIVLLLSKAIVEYFEPRKIRNMFIGLIILLFSGNFWFYPENLAQSWDTTISHKNYFTLRKEAIGYFESNNIPIENVSAGFPTYAAFKYTDINNDTRKFKETDLKSEWVIYSNIFNYSDEEIAECKKMKLMKHFRRGNLFMSIYKNPVYLNKKSE